MPRGKNTNVWMICQECDMQNHVTRVNERTLELKKAKLIIKKYCSTCNDHTPHKNGKKITHSSN